MGLRNTLLAVSSSMIAASAFAGGSMTAGWVEIANNFSGDSIPDYSTAVFGDDPILGSTPARTFDLVVSTTSPVQWCSCDLQINLAGTQSFYVNAAGNMRDPFASTWAAHPAKQYSTFICVYNFGNVVTFPTGVLLGMAQYPVESGVGTAVLNTTRIDAAWGSLTPFTGTSTIARVTILNGFSGGFEFGGRVGTANNVANQDTTYNGYAFRPAALVAASNADANADGFVDTRDFNILAGHFGSTGMLPVGAGNFNGDLSIDSLDMNVLIAQYGTHRPSGSLGAAVPEPAALSLLPVCFWALRRRTR